MKRSTAALALLTLCACTSPPGTKTKTIVTPWSEIQVPGVKIFTTHISPAPADYDNRGAYLQHDFDAKKVTGRDAMRVVVAKGIQDPAQLAVFAQLFLDSIGGQIVNSPADGQGDRAAALIVPPSIKDGVLEYWHWAGGMAHMIERSRVNLTTFERETDSGQDK